MHCHFVRELPSLQADQASIFTAHAIVSSFFFFNDTATTEIYTLSLHDALPIWFLHSWMHDGNPSRTQRAWLVPACSHVRSEEHTSELQSRPHLVCRLLLEKKKNKTRSAL